MPKTDSQAPEKDDLKKLYNEDIHPHIPAVVCQVCANLNYFPGELGLEAAAQRLTVSLWENGYKRLRSFRHESSPETWLYTVAKRDIGD